MKPSGRVVGYMRISSSKQLKGKGLQEQKNAIESNVRQILKLKPHDRIPQEQFQIYIETPWSGAEGTAGDRPELQAALDDVCGSNGILIVRDISRLSRSVADTQKILSRLKDSQCDLVSIRESLSSLIWGREWAFAWAAELAESRLKMLCYRTTKAAATNIAAGKHWGRIPYGYVLNEAGQLEPHPEQFPIMEEIASRLNAGESTYRIAKLLNQRRVRTQTGRLWEAKQVANAYAMFTNHNS